MERLIQFRVFTDEVVNATASVTSSAIPLDLCKLESLMLTATSTGDAHDLKIDLLTSTTADGTYSDPLDFVELTASTATDFPNSATDMVPISIPPTLGPYVKVKVTGVGANPADTEVTIVAVAREDI